MPDFSLFFFLFAFFFASYLAKNQCIILPLKVTYKFSHQFLAVFYVPYFFIIFLYPKHLPLGPLMRCIGGVMRSPRANSETSQQVKHMGGGTTPQVKFCQWQEKPGGQVQTKVPLPQSSLKKKISVGKWDGRQSKWTLE